MSVQRKPLISIEILSLRRAQESHLMTVVPFKRPPKIRPQLCKHGHHKWLVDKAKQFDVKQGKLITVYRCSRCDKTRVKSH